MTDKNHVETRRIGIKRTPDVETNFNLCLYDLPNRGPTILRITPVHKWARIFI